MKPDCWIFWLKARESDFRGFFMIKGEKMRLKRRKKTRVQSRFLVIYPRNGEYVEAYATNISEAGMFIETNYPLANGSESEFFTNYDVMTKGIMRAKVVRHHRDRGRLRGMAVNFNKSENHFIFDLLLKQNAFNKKYMGLSSKGLFSPKLMTYRLRKTLGV